ncbi:hypothetical protein [Corynebacterium sp. CCUG 51687]|uniref:hypothetical protein n=1 Tax=Corynebacterium sp. CCUG 51687 TaxID=2823897 RepID=UPI00210966AD|nr:hypothetical protein [Corynebacterium sp. CCUG 51687]MCQ4611867.1 hypothetical protein [Corynebacterium sp. CCUG 51687]
MTEDEVWDEIEALTSELNSITDKSYDESHNFIPGQMSEEDNRRVREITVRQRELFSLARGFMDK